MLTFKSIRRRFAGGGTRAERAGQRSGVLEVGQGVVHTQKQEASAALVARRLRRRKAWAVSVCGLELHSFPTRRSSDHRKSVV